MTETTIVKLWRYYLPNESSMGGWAEIVISSTGFFAAVSDYGNYAFAWRSFGPRDFREFLVGIDWHYLASKLGSSNELQEYDGDATVKAIKRAIIEARIDRGREEIRAAYGRTTGQWSRHDARAMWDRIREYDVDDSLHGFWRFLEESDGRFGDEPWHMAEHRINCQLEHFCKVTFERFKELLRAELATEAEAAKGAA